ncbi:MAG: HAD hydrolase-like protein, partial [Oscillospiraceae bacterium]|nr:HAD hydrolase-like protein [Oscillospiraceae bacterium]
ARFRTKVPLKNTLVVGDQIFTDVLGAHAAGMKAAMVLPLFHEEGKGFDMKRSFEQQYIDLYLEEHGEFL